jgi:hypothetical protein
MTITPSEVRRHPLWQTELVAPAPLIPSRRSALQAIVATGVLVLIGVLVGALLLAR